MSAQLSVQVQNQLRVSDKVIAAARTHGPKIAPLLAAQAKEVQGVQTKATTEAYEAVFSALADGLAQDANALREAELAYYAEKADDAPVRAARDASATDLGSLLSLLRSTIESTLGAPALRTYGLEGEVPRTPSKLLNHAKNVLQQLASNEKTVTTALGTTFDTIPAAKAIKTKIDALAGHIDDDNREARELEDALTRRNRAMDAWTEGYQGTASALEGLFRRGGYKELADRVRPTQRKARGEDTEDGDAAQAPPAGG
jgi:hypothetical protein